MIRNALFSLVLGLSGALFLPNTAFAQTISVTPNPVPYETTIIIIDVVTNAGVDRYKIFDPNGTLVGDFGTGNSGTAPWNEFMPSNLVGIWHFLLCGLPSACNNSNTYTDAINADGYLGQDYEVILQDNAPPPPPPPGGYTGLWENPSEGTSVLLAGVAGSVQATGANIWLLLSVMGIPIAFIIGEQLIKFIKRTVGKGSDNSERIGGFYTRGLPYKGYKRFRSQKWNKENTT